MESLRFMICTILICCLVLPSWTQSSDAGATTSGHFYGYWTDSSKAQRAWENKFRDGISRENLRESMRRLSARPHHVGSPYDKDNAEWILSRFKEWGFDVAIYPGLGFSVAAEAMRQSWEFLKEKGTSNGIALPQYRNMHELMGFSEVWDFEKKWAS